MVAMAQRLDARSLFFRPQLSVSTFLVLALKICRNRFGCHSQSVAEPAPSKLSNFGHSVDDSWAATKRWRVGKICQPLPNPEPERSRDQEAHTKASRCRDSYCFSLNCSIVSTLLRRIAHSMKSWLPVPLNVNQLPLNGT
jgi:hypothetical protein